MPSNEKQNVLAVLYESQYMGNWHLLNSFIMLTSSCSVCVYLDFSLCYYVQ